MLNNDENQQSTPTLDGKPLSGTEQSENDRYQEAGFPPELPKSTPKRYPTWMDLMTIVGVFVASAIMASVVMMVLMKFSGLEKELIEAIAYSIQFVLVILFVVFQRRSNGDRSRLIKLGFKANNFPLLLWGVILVLATSIVIEPLLLLLPSEMMERVFGSMGRGGWVILQVVILAPLLEETLFRGLIQDALIKRYGAFTSVLISSLMFGVIHIVPQQVINAFVVGIILGYIYYRTRSLSVVMIIHAINNALAYVSLEIMGEETAMMSIRQTLNNDTAYYLLYGVCVVIFVMGIVGVVTSLRKYEKEKDTEKPALTL